MKKQWFGSPAIVCMALVLLFCSQVSADPVVISGVPAYLNQSGCGPTSIASVLGYYDAVRGYSNMFTAQGSAMYLTPNVLDQILSIANYCGTSNGETDVSNVGPGLIAYAASKGYGFQASLTRLSLNATWSLLVREVNAGRLPIFEADSDGDGSADHLVPVFGYDDRGVGGKWYACYTGESESETPIWEPFIKEVAGTPYGFYEEIQIQPTQPVPEPATFALLLLGLSPLVLYRRKISGVPIILPRSKVFH